MAQQKTYAILYLRPDGWWIAGEGWTERAAAERKAKDHFTERGYTSGFWKVVMVGGKPYLAAKELEGREAA